MKKARKITSILTLAVAFCFALVSVVHAAPSDPVTKGWASNNLVNKNKATKIPIWKITQPGTAKSVQWVTHTPNPRFAIYDPGTPGNELDDLVLDNETGLVWARNANLLGGVKTWEEAVVYCRGLKLGNRMGWRLPTVEELASLVDTSQSDPALPSGHPFQDVPSDFWHWSSTSYEFYSNNTWCVHMYNGWMGYGTKADYNSQYVWPVRGGSGPILVPHTP